MPVGSAASLLRGVGAAAQEVRKRWCEGVGREGTALGGGWCMGCKNVFKGDRIGGCFLFLFFWRGGGGEGGGCVARCGLVVY